MLRKIELKKAAGAAAAVLMAAMICSAWLTAMPSDVYAAADLTRQNASSDTATVKMGKTLTVNQNNKFPGITDFNFTIERVKAWDNSNTSASQNGKTITKSNIPMPAASTTSSHSITVSGDTATVAIGNFTGSESTDTETVKNRFTEVPITFTKAGYYMYKVKEVSSTPAGVPGVGYDSHEYFITVYVCNKMDSDGNTIDGVYVHSMTAYRNTSGTDNYQPDLSDIAKTTDNNGTAAKQNTAANLGKVGLSSDASPNILKADNMWNTYTTSDLIITNNVQGTLGDRSKEFEFTITLTGLENNKAYQLDGDINIGTVTTGTYSQTTDTITTNAQGAATFNVKLRDDQQMTLEALNATSKYTILESASDHIPSYKITAAGGSSASIAKSSDAKTTDSQSLSTVQETVDASDKNQTVAFQNKRDLAALTGARSSTIALFALAFVILALGAAVIAARKASRNVI